MRRVKRHRNAFQLDSSSFMTSKNMIYMVLDMLLILLLVYVMITKQYYYGILPVFLGGLSYSVLILFYKSNNPNMYMIVAIVLFAFILGVLLSNFEFMAIFFGFGIISKYVHDQWFFNHWDSNMKGGA